MFDLTKLLTDSKGQDFVCFLTIPFFIVVAIAQIMSAPFMLDGLISATMGVMVFSLTLFFIPFKEFGINSLIAFLLSMICFMVVFLFFVKPEIIPKHIINSWKYAFMGIGFVYYRIGRNLGKIG
jgi:hypothetical protein